MATGRVNVGVSSTDANVYIQSTEPNDKEGIWFQTPFEEYDTLNIGNFGQIIQESPWAYIDPYGEQAYGSYENLFILFGGKTNSTVYKYLYKYDLEKRIWTKLTDSVYIENMYTSVLGHNNILYFIGSYSHPNTVTRYDLNTNTWLSTLPAPNNIFGSAVVKINGKFYKLGGSADGSTYTTYHAMFNPETGTWTQLAPCPYARPGSSWNIAAYKNGYYAQSGTNLYYYNIDTNTWTLEKTLSASPMSGNFIAIVRDVIYFNVGGYIYEYDILTKTERSTNLVADMGAKCNLIYKDKVLIPKFTANPQGGVLRYTDVNYKRTKNYVLLCENQDNGFDTCLFNLKHRKINNRITQQINNALLYINDVEQVVPTYYGDGTKWIKFKN